jgi:hypothetical protein
LRAHRQVVKFDDKFTLKGTPRFAVRLEWTPFHHYCRKSVVLNLPGNDDGLTDHVKESAAKLLIERERGISINRHPVDAFAG